MKNQHILPNGKDWIVKKETAERASRKFPLKSQAIRYAQKLAKNQDVHVYVHGTDGVISEVKNNKQSLVPTNKTKVDTQHRIHVYYDDGEWSVKTDNAQKAIKRFNSKYNAIRFAHEVADRRNAAWVVHDENNRITHIDFPPHYRSPFSALLHLR